MFTYWKRKQSWRHREEGEEKIPANPSKQILRSISKKTAGSLLLHGEYQNILNGCRCMVIPYNREKWLFLFSRYRHIYQQMKEFGALTLPFPSPFMPTNYYQGKQTEEYQYFLKYQTWDSSHNLSSKKQAKKVQNEKRTSPNPDT